MAMLKTTRVKQYMTKYEDFITQNAGSVSQIESALRSLTYIVPARFKDVELASESLHSGVQLLSLYHDRLLSQTGSPSQPKPSLHNRYTRFWTKNSPMYKKLAMLVTMIQYTELLWEMAAKRKGEKVRWRVILALEGLKALCRIVMLHLTDKRPLLTSPLPEREVDNIITPPSSAESSPPETPPNEPVSWKMPRTGLSLPSLPTNISHYLLSKVLTPDDLKPPPSLLPLLRGSAYLGEMLYILRPIIYAVALRKYQSDKQSWKPWLLGFGLEYAARELVKRVTVGSGGLEKEEMGRREWALAWWALRGAGYENFVGPWIKSANGLIRDKPILGLAAGIVEDYQWLWDNYYFSTATL